MLERTGDIDGLQIPGLSDELLRASGMGSCVIELLDEGQERACAQVFQCDAGFCRLTGLALAAGQGVIFGDAGLPVEWLPVVARVLANARSEHVESWNSRTTNWIAADIVPMMADQVMVGILVRDIGEEKRRESACLERVQRYRSLIDALPLPVWVLTPEGETRFVNRLFENFFGCSRSRHESFRWEALIHPEDLPGFRYDLEQALHEKSSLGCLVRGRRSDGQWRWLEMSAAPRWAIQGGFLGLAGNCRDVTDRRELEEANEQLLRAERSARTAAESTSRLKDEFMATISHELRTPLTTIMGWSDLLLQRVDPADPLYKGLNVINASGQALRRLIADMLDLSGMLMGKLILDMEPLDLVEEVIDAVRSLDVAVRERSLKVTTELPETCCLIMGDRTRVQQILWNLLSNAAKFTQEGGHVHVRMDMETGACRVVVQDDGVGIAPDFLPYLFTRFRQADATTTRRYGGLGLGLSIVQQLVELHGGTVHAHSDGIGQGACFTVGLPMIAVQPEETLMLDRQPRVRAVGTDSDTLSNLRLLLVDDQREIHGFMRQALERHGAQVHTADSPADALRLIGAGDHARYDLVISDIGMPGMDGYALAKVIREELGLPASTLPMIALTALTSPEDRQRALAGGFQAHVVKPCNMAILIAEIRRLLRR